LIEFALAAAVVLTQLMLMFVDIGSSLFDELTYVMFAVVYRY